MRSLQILLAVATIAFSSAPGARAVVYAIDPDHSRVTLNATHLGVGTVEGRFDKLSGTLEYDPTNIGASAVRVRIDAASINTNHSSRDEHLRSADFLDTRTYPEITFESTEVTKSKHNELRIAGNLSLHGVTRPVVLLAKFGGATMDMEGKKRVAFATSVSINRKDYGITWNRMIGGSMLVGQMVQISLSIEGVEQTAGLPK